MRLTGDLVGYPEAIRLMCGGGGGASGREGSPDHHPPSPSEVRRRPKASGRSQPVAGRPSGTRGPPRPRSRARIPARGQIVPHRLFIKFFTLRGRGGGGRGGGAKCCKGQGAHFAPARHSAGAAGMRGSHNVNPTRPLGPQMQETQRRPAGDPSGEKNFRGGEEKAGEPKRNESLAQAPG